MTTQNSNFTNQQRSVCFGVDVGSSKLVVGKSYGVQSNGGTKPVTETVGDTSDTRLIPNRIYLPTDMKTGRSYGNQVSVTKATNFDQRVTSNIEQTKEFNIFGQVHNLPLYFAQNMVLTYIKKVMKMRINTDTEDINIVTYVPRYSYLDNLKLSNLDAFGIDCILRADLPESETVSSTDGDSVVLQEPNNVFKHTKFVPISDVHALIMAYVQRYSLSAPEGDETDVVLIDVGHTKQQILRFKVNKKSPSLINVELVGYASSPNTAGDLITTSFCKYLKSKLRPKFTAKDTVFRDQVTKLKHLLSSNQTMQTWFTGEDADECVTVTRNELNTVIEHTGVLASLTELMSYIFNPSNSKKNQSGTGSRQPIHIEILGGSGRIPLIISTVEQFLNKNRLNAKICKSLHPDEAVAEGASFYGWLLSNPEKLTVNYKRYVRSDCTLICETKNEYTGIYEKSSTIPLFKKGTLIQPLTIRNPFPRVSGFDSTCVSVPYDSRLTISTGDTRMNLIVDPNMCKKLYAERFNIGNFGDRASIQIEVHYNMNDNIEVTRVSCSETDIPYKIRYCSDHSSSSYDVAALKRTLSAMEADLLKKDMDVHRRQILENFMEEYYYKKDVVNDLLKTIQRVKNTDRNSWVTLDDESSATLDRYDEMCRPNLEPHVKEIYEFYQFCTAYMYDESAESSNDNSLIKLQHDHILKLLDDRYSVIRLTEATTIVSDIMTRYH